MPAGRAPARVVLISIDTLRADHLGTYGHSRFTSPILDQLGLEGAVFEDASATAPWTLPSHASLLTGLYPARHGVTTSRTALPDGLPTLASLLRDRGFETAAIVNSPWLHRDSFGLTRDFQRYDAVHDPDYKRRSPSTRITDRAIEWLGELRDRRLLLFVHYYDVHADYASLPAYEKLFVEPYAGTADGSAWQLMRANFAEEHIRKCQESFDPAYCEFGSSEKPRRIDAAYEPVTLTAEDVGHLERLYDAGIRQMDTEIGRLVGFLRSEGLLDDTLLVVTSDHGEEFMEHGRVDHFLTTYQESLHVPLIFRGPGVPAGLRIREPVSSVDVVPTILALVGGDSGAGPEASTASELEGLDLTPLFVGAKPAGVESRTIFGEASGGLQYDEAIRGVYPVYASIRRGRYKGVYDATSETFALFDLASDPHEQIDLARREPELASELERAVRARLEATARRAPRGAAPQLDPSERDQLRALGYIAE